MCLRLKLVHRLERLVGQVPHEAARKCLKARLAHPSNASRGDMARKLSHNALETS